VKAILTKTLSPKIRDFASFFISSLAITFIFAGCTTGPLPSKSTSTLFPLGQYQNQIEVTLPNGKVLFFEAIVLSKETETELIGMSQFKNTVFRALNKDGKTKLIFLEKNFESQRRSLELLAEIATSIHDLPEADLKNGDIIKNGIQFEFSEKDDNGVYKIIKLTHERFRAVITNENYVKTW
jgi:hypothetical protein